MGRPGNTHLAGCQKSYESLPATYLPLISFLKGNIYCDCPGLIFPCLLSVCRTYNLSLPLTGFGTQRSHSQRPQPHLDLTEITGPRTLSPKLQMNEICRDAWRKAVLHMTGTQISGIRGEAVVYFCNHGTSDSCLQVATSHIDFGLGHVTYFDQQGIRECNTSRGLKKHLFIGACPFLFFPRSPSTTI